MNTHLDRPVDEHHDHVVGPADAPITVVEYGSYACRFCQAANERIIELRAEFGERLRYVFRHRPISGRELAHEAAALVERAKTPDDFWRAHVALMDCGEGLTEEKLTRIAREFGLDDESRSQQARERVAAD